MTQDGSWSVPYGDRKKGQTEAASEDDPLLCETETVQFSKTLISNQLISTPTPAHLLSPS